MQARATHLPHNKHKTFALQVDTGKVHVFVAAEDMNGPSQKIIVRYDGGKILPVLFAGISRPIEWRCVVNPSRSEGMLLIMLLVILLLEDGLLRGFRGGRCF